MAVSRRGSAVNFPEGRQFAVTWSIPDDFGGMTGALLHRSRAFVRLAGTPVDVLTFDARADYPALELSLRERGELVDGLSLVNIWEWLRTHDLPVDAAGALDLRKNPFTPLESDPAHVSSRRGDSELSRERRASDGTTVLQVDYYRTDGTLLASDRRDVDSPGTLGGRSVVLCDRDGSPLRSWSSVWALYRFWVDLLREGEPSFLIVDSKTIANFAATYRRKRAVTMHLVHSSHLEGDERPFGQLRESRRKVFENLDAFDSVVLLTERQRDDVQQLLGKRKNLAVVPNSRDLPATTDVAERAAGAGIVLASLTSRKRLDHALRAVHSARQSGSQVTLDVFGEGEERARLESLVTELGLAEAVRMPGHDPQARAKLAEASFLLLTSHSEGLPLVLVEAMAAGCIPIAYDVPYGPADIIQHGRNGFLVESGDIEGVARAILDLQRMSPRELTRLRKNAQRTAADFSDLAVARTWAREMRAADARKPAERPAPKLD